MFLGAGAGAGKIVARAGRGCYFEGVRRPFCTPRPAGFMPDPQPSAQRYLVAARKYRPATFEELVAQEHVTETLQNALRLGRLAHAYLFSGPRGVGKTTAARILAKAINCTTPLEERKAGAEPCRVCDSCRSFEEGRSLNIIEIDAASNNKVDDIRDLRETVRIPPQGSRKKVYIIDEVHMLSNAAFNALLKTLEEPPPHALFIFATTEPHKVLPTILSRCQRFDFRRIPVPDTVEKLREICQEEGITADEESLMLVARKGDGALRDALSAFDQAVSLCGTDLEYAGLAQALGVVDVDLFFRLTEHAAEGQSAGMLRLVEEVVRTGYDLQEFLSGLAEHLRNLIVARTTGGTDLIEAAEATRARYAEAARALAEADLLRLLMIASEAEDAVKQSAQPRLKLEMALLKMAHLPRAADLHAALQKLDRLEKLAREGRLPDPSSTGTPPAAGAAPAAETSTAEDASPTSSKHEQQQAEAQSAAPARSSSTASNKASAAPETAPPPVEDEEAPTGNEEEDAPAAAAPSAAAAPPEADAPPPEMSVSPSPSPAAETAEEAARAEAAEDDADEDTGSERSPGGEDDNGVKNAATGPAPENPAAPAAPQPYGYRDLFGAPALQRRPPSSADAGEGEAPPEDASAPDASASSSGAAEASSAQAPAPPPDDGEAGDGADDVVERLTAHWDAFVRSVRKASGIRLASCLQHATPVSARAGTVTVAVPDAYHMDTLGSEVPLLAAHLPAAVCEPAAQFRFVVENSLEAPGAAETASKTSPYELLATMRKEHPVVKALFDSFGGEPVH